MGIWSEAYCEHNFQTTGTVISEHLVFQCFSEALHVCLLQSYTTLTSNRHFSCTAVLLCLMLIRSGRVHNKYFLMHIKYKVLNCNLKDFFLDVVISDAFIKEQGINVSNISNLGFGVCLFGFFSCLWGRWKADNYSQFWGMTVEEAFKKRLGTFPPSHSLLNMRESPVSVVYNLIFFHNFITWKNKYEQLQDYDLTLNASVLCKKLPE